MSNPLAITKVALLTPFNMLDDAIILIDNGKILAAGEAAQIEIPAGFREIPLEGLIIAPGFIDQHLHGGGGADIMEATPECFAEVAKFHATHGTTSFLATTVSASRDQLVSIAKAYATFSDTGYKGANCLGLHLEGPYISPKYAGIHSLQTLRPPTMEEIQTLQKLTNNGIKMITMAPEVPGVMEIVPLLREKGIICSIGHSEVDYDTAIDALRNGFLNITHCFNQTGPFHHREPGIVGAALTKPEFSVELIADGIHLHPVTIDLVWRAKGFEKIILVSDAMSPTGLPNGAYHTADGELTLYKGKLTNQAGNLAGSALTLERAVRNFMEYTNCELTDAFRMASYNPAKLLGINKRKGSLYPGKDADLIALTPDFDVVMTMIEGEVISGLISLD